MTTNRLAKSEVSIKRAAHELCAQGNAYLRGEIPGVKGDYIDRPRHDVHWFVEGGRPTLGWKQ